MPWGSPLITALSSPTYRWVWKLSVVGVSDAPGVAYTAASLPSIGDPVIGRSVTVNGPRISPGNWSSTLGTFTVELVGDLSTLLSSLTRGTFVSLSVGLPEWLSSDYEVVAYGQVQQISGRNLKQAQLTCRDLLSALRSRPTTSIGYLPIGYRLAPSGAAVVTTLSAAYAAGDSTIHVASTTGFAVGAISTACLITPSSGDPFILTYSGTGVGTLTGASAHGQHGTTEVAAASGDSVQPLLWGNGHPIEQVRRYLLSVAGASTHGYDVLPAGDGLALPYDFIDHTDTTTQYLAAEPTMSIETVSDVPIDDPLGWIAGWLSKCAIFITTRQGLLTVRAGWPTNTTSIATSATITDDDIEVQGASWEAWDPDSSVEAIRIIVESNDANTSTGTAEANATLPAVDEVRYDLTDLAYGGTSDQQTARDAVAGRVYWHHQRIPSRYTFQCVGLRLAILAPGDLVDVTTRQIGGRTSATFGGLSANRMLVVQVNADWGRGRVTIVALSYPPSEDQFP